MKKNRLSIRAVISLILSLILLCMPAMAFSMNGNYVVNVRAEDKTGTEESTDAETESGSEENSAEDNTENETATGEDSDTSGDNMETSAEDTTGDDMEDSTENPTEDATEDGTVSGNEVPELVCSCEDKCGSYEYDRSCPICAEDYKKCAYKKPNVTISINKPDGWYNDTAFVSFSVTDSAHTGNFETAKIQAKIGQSGSWTDVTEDRKLEISENCTVYVQVTDQKGNTYERSRAVRCFDTTKPTLNAAVSDGLLSVQVHDTDSGAKAVYVNGYEFTELTNGTLNIRLQQFDAGYEYFTISAMDNAGNMSEVYKTANPYYTDPEKTDGNEKNPAEQLPVNAQATKPSSATAQVTEHTKTDSDGNTVSENSLAEQKKQAMAEAAASEKKEESGEKEKSETGKEFYTIQTASEKVFYLIIDRDGEEEMVYFLTEVTENDLLNVTADNSETLPKNSAALESAIPAEDSALPNNNGEMPEDTEQTEEDTEDVENTEETESTEETEPEEKTEEPNPVISYILMGALAIAFIGGAYYFKVVRKKKEDFLDEDDEEDEEEYENEDGETGDGTDDDFFAGDDRETDAAETIKEPDNE